MDSIERNISASWRHRVFFTEHLFDSGNEVLQQAINGAPSERPTKALVVLESALVSACPGLPSTISEWFGGRDNTLRLVVSPLIVSGGEQAKESWAGVHALHEAINRHHLDRHSCLVAIGGGALLDLAGLAAATAHRGIRLVRAPSTTLAQCDSGVGVKNAINAFGKKNFIGTFAVPFAVVNDFQLLSTLAPRDKRGGYSEAVKVACIRDAEFFAAIERDVALLRRFEPEAMRRLIRRCAELHMDHIALGGDPFEFGSARPLDFGHWSAHRLEQLSGFRLRHGEAVAIGLALDTIYSRRVGLIDAASCERVLALLEGLGFALFAPEVGSPDGGREWPLLIGLEEFREHLGGGMAVPLLTRIGRSCEANQMDPAILAASMSELCKRGAGAA